MSLVRKITNINLQVEIDFHEERKTVYILIYNKKNICDKCHWFGK